VTRRPTLGQVLREAIQDPHPAALRLSPHQWKTVRALAACRTRALGGQLFHCTNCQREHFVAHSCRNRHCPQCQGPRAADWLAKQEAALLPIPYFHLVFTLPHGLNGLLRQNRRALFKLLFDSVSQTLLEFGEGRLQAQIGITAVLHTWSQTLLDHDHLHCIVTGGGVARDGKGWVHSCAHYLFPVQALSRMFRGKFLAGLNALFDAGELEFHGELAPWAGASRFAALLREAARPQWVVYAKRPFAGPKQVLAYLSRYTHRVAISNRRLISADAHTVSFEYKDYADGARRKTMTLETVEFVRRFGLHVLPERFVKIRHYGLLGNRQRQERLAGARALLSAATTTTTTAAPAETAAAKEISAPSARAVCPFCQQPALVLLREVEPERAARLVSVLDSS
jgi:hypothetical protein